uniref:Uncharacterized protein n=1 Tax=Anguilla anguilla TaxID=7936 RepID=A0A0E9SHE0_ANGAN
METIGYLNRRTLCESMRRGSAVPRITITWYNFCTE